MDFWVPERDWAEERCVIVGSGPTVAKADFEPLRRLGFKFIVLNERYKTCPWADFLYFADYLPFYVTNKTEPRFKAFEGRKVTLDPRAVEADPSILLLRNFGKGGPGRPVPALVKRPGWINNGGNSGYGALGLAYHLGPPRLILLVGFDMRAVEGRTHADPDDCGAIYSRKHRYETQFAPRFPALADALRAEGVTVVNCTDFDEEGMPVTALDCFPVARP